MKMIRKYLVSIFIVMMTVSVFAQAASDSQIELPDLTTVVTGENSEEYAPAPDFTDVLNMPYDSGDLAPVLPAAAVENDGIVSSPVDEYQNKDIYAEGKIGGGYPATFEGNFEISRLYGADPFRIAFNHESTGGYAGHNLADGYNNNDTSIELQKDFIRKNLKWGFGGSYEDLGKGFQGKTESVSSNNQDSVGLFFNLLWSMPKNFQLSFNVDSEFYYRFAQITYNKSQANPVPDWIKNTSRVSAEPELKFSWINNGFDISLGSVYSLEAWNKVSNRGEFDFAFSWKNDSVKLFTDVGLVVGNTLGENKLTVPFTAGLNAYLPVYFSDRKLNLSLAGGLESQRFTTSELEKKYAFSGLTQLPSEASDWFADFELLVPLKTSFTGTVAAGYKKTAFNNGIFTPDYVKESFDNGLYTYTQKDREELFTDFAFTWKYKLFAVTAGYRSNWMDVPVLENKHTISVDFTLQSSKGKWGTTLGTSYLLDAKDNKPKINLEGYVQASSAVRIVLSVNDMLKLLGAEERVYKGQYISNSGNAVLLVKFLF